MLLVVNQRDLYSAKPLNSTSQYLHPFVIIGVLYNNLMNVLSLFDKISWYKCESLLVCSNDNAVCLHSSCYD